MKWLALDLNQKNSGRVRGNWLILTFDSSRLDLGVSRCVTKKIPETSSFLRPFCQRFTLSRTFFKGEGGSGPALGQAQRRRRHLYSLATPSLLRSGAPPPAATYPGRGRAHSARLRLPGQGPALAQRTPDTGNAGQNRLNPRGSL